MRGRGPRRPSPSPPSAARPYSARRRRLRGRAAARPSAVRTPANSRPRPAGWRSASRRRAWRAPAAAAGPPAGRGAENTSRGRSATPRRSAQPPTWPGGHPQTGPLLHSAVALRLGKICGGLPQDLIRASQFTIVAFQFLQALVLVGRQAAPLARIAFGLAHPIPQRLTGAAELARDRRDRGPLRRMLGTMLADHPNGPLSYLS